MNRRDVAESLANAVKAKEQVQELLAEARRRKGKAAVPGALDGPLSGYTDGDIKEKTYETLAMLNAVDTRARAVRLARTIVAVSLVTALILITVVPPQVQQAAARSAAAAARAQFEAEAMARDVPAAASGGVTRNADWTAVIREFDGVRMALVPAGCFVMGSQSGRKDEQPAHRVCFESPFWLDVTEVTNAQFMRLGGVAQHKGGWSAPQQPRDNIIWAEASAFCQQRGMRLPTEAEWEYAARGPDGLIYPWGNTFAGANVVYGFNSVARTRDVGSKPGGASWVGALDMIGNLSEWVSDWYREDYYRTSPVQAPQGPAQGVAHVQRGGSWYDGDDLMRAARRLGYTSAMFYTVGFRCVRSK